MPKLAKMLVAEESDAISPIGTDAAESRQRRRARSIEYRKSEEQYAVPREIAAAVILFRTRRGLTQAQLAGMIRTSHSQISRIESGEHLPSMSTLQRLATAMGSRVHIHFET